MAFGCGAITRQCIQHFFVCWPIPFHLVLQDVFRKVDQHRTWASCCCNVEGLANCHRDIFGAHYQLVVLGHTACNSYGVALLKRICTNCCGGDLTGNAHHRNGIHKRITQWGDHICCSRPTRHHGNTWSTSDVCITLGHVAGALFMAHKNVADR